LGLAGSRSILLDDNALGLGWHIGSGAVPANQLDALTVVTHELGHLLGYGDEDTAFSGNSLMSGSLSAGLSRVSTNVVSPLSSSLLGNRTAHDELFGELGQSRREAKSASLSSRLESSAALWNSLSAARSPSAAGQEFEDDYDGCLLKRDRHAANLDDLFAELAQEEQTDL
jgi:hypothetical protein